MAGFFHANREVNVVSFYSSRKFQNYNIHLNSNFSAYCFLFVNCLSPVGFILILVSFDSMSFTLHMKIIQYA